MNTMMRTRNIDQWSYVDFGTRRTTACHRECHKPCSSRARVSERIGHPRDAMGSQLISCTGLLLARIHEITAADYSCTFAHSRFSYRSEEHTSELQSPMYLVCR